MLLQRQDCDPRTNRVDKVALRKKGNGRVDWGGSTRPGGARRVDARGLMGAFEPHQVGRQ